MNNKTVTKKKDGSKMRSLLQGLTSSPAPVTEKKPKESQKEKHPKTVLCISIEEEKADKVRQLSKVHGVPISTVIEDAISLYITKYEEKYGQVQKNDLPALPKL